MLHLTVRCYFFVVSPLCEVISRKYCILLCCSYVNVHLYSVCTVLLVARMRAWMYLWVYELKFLAFICHFIASMPSVLVQQFSAWMCEQMINSLIMHFDNVVVVVNILLSFGISCKWNVREQRIPFNCNHNDDALIAQCTHKHNDSESLHAINK